MSDYTTWSTSALLMAMHLPSRADQLALITMEIDRRFPVPGPQQPPPKIYPRWRDPNATAAEIRDSIIASVGMMADARTDEMQAAYDRALARDGLVDSPDGPRPSTATDQNAWKDGYRPGETLTPEEAVGLARRVIQKYGAEANKPSVHLAIRVINGAHERDDLRASLEKYTAAVSELKREWESLPKTWGPRDGSKSADFFSAIRLLCALQ